MRVLKVNKENTKNILSDLLKRSPNNYDQYAGTVQGILDEIKEKGDEALFAYTEKFDKCKLTKDTIQVTEEEIKAAYEKVDDSLVEVIRKSLVNIREYHEKQKRNSWFDAKPNGTILGQKMTALASVGVYVPGGKAAYPSSVLMNIVPAKVAGVKKIVMVTPPNKDGEVTPATLVAANEAGATHIYKVGGAQAIGALAYGTESIEKVDKIVGPGNIYVALAKKAVYGHVSIDSIAGPSEILVLADDTANPHFVAADLLSQAEHDELASAILVTTSKTLGEKVQEEIEGYLKKLSRAEIIEKSLENFGYILEAETLDEALEVVNEIASEHLEIVTANPFEVMTKVRNAGAIFIGEYSSEPLGDYFAGPNHVLPTNGTAKFFSPLNVDDFVKKSSIIYYSKDALKAIHKDIETFAQAEGHTSETKIIVDLNLDGSGKYDIDTGIGFFDHMLNSFAKHGFFDLTCKVDGDLEVDCHHTIEDTGIVLGQAIREAVGNKKGIRRFGNFLLPMDETLVLGAVDLSGRPYCVCDLPFTVERVGGFDTEMVQEFFYAISYSAAMNLHLKLMHGSNNHHIMEAAFKAFAKALDEACSYDPRITDVLSTKGAL